MCRRALLRYTCSRGHLGVYDRQFIYHEECHRSSEHAYRYGVDWDTQPEFVEGLGYIDDDKCRVCIRNDILELQDPQKMLAEYLKLDWEVNDASQLLEASEARVEDAGRRAEAFIDAVQSGGLTGQLRTMLEKIRNEAVAHWRRAYDGMTGATMLYHNKRTAARMCVDLSHEEFQDWLPKDSTVALMYWTNSQLIFHHLHEMRDVVQAEFWLVDDIGRAMNSNDEG